MPLVIDLQRPRILIAEDNYLIAEEVGELVRGCGYAVAGAAPSLESGMALIAKDAVDGAVLDIDLAGTPSFPMCRALSARGVPFLFLSGYSPNTVVPEEFRKTIHLSKPLAPAALESALRNLVGWAPASGEKPVEPTFANAVLDSLNSVAKVALAASLERVQLRHGDVLDVPGRAVDHIYFPIEGLISMFAGTAATRIEVASIGCDGMTAPGVLLGDTVSPGHTMVQVSGSAWRIRTRTLQRLAEGDASLRRHFLHQVSVALRQLADTASYSGRATIVERLARWLLQATYRLGNRRLGLTHDVLADILGVRRPSITTGLQALEGRHLIRSTRRAIVVLDPAGLAELARR
ncbi:cAMP-binding domain of CRP or a regulatory subunit of cAMP-dependent protein kinases [Rhodospirillales bacterium URHD0017]|nr:cAMP-binding domain of CRP or a regulatory subunit of cAMP-dependent protein kinases [Rhodospirillales bacterium URHD0017]